MAKKTIALDLNGTLLHSDNTISDYTAETVKKIQSKGYRVIIAAGRPYRMAFEHYRRPELLTPMIFFNGSLTCLSEKRWEWEHSATIDKQYLLDVLDIQQSIEADFIASEYRKKFYISAQDHNRVNPQLFGVPEIIEKMSMGIKKITENLSGILMQVRRRDKYALVDEMRKHFNYKIEIDSRGGPLNILEFSPKGINRVYALKYLLKVLDISQDSLIALGDEHNDIETLSFVGTGYAMKNASDIPLSFVNEQTEFFSEEDGVAKELERIFS